MKKLMTVLAIAGTFYAGTLKAQTDGGVADTASSSFIANASAGGMKEVQTGKLAESKGQSSSARGITQEDSIEYFKPAGPIPANPKAADSSSTGQSVRRQWSDSRQPGQRTARC